MQPADLKGNGGGYNQQEEQKGDDVPMAATFDKVFVPTIFGDDNLEFVVSNPSMAGGHIEYIAKGVDRQGPWDGKRRYSHFHHLREVLIARWPGIIIPRIPPKKAIVRIQY